MKLNLASPAKLNLFLHINGQRADGYHELETLFQFLDYGDELEIRLTDSHIRISPEFEGLKQQDNLIYRAAIALQRAAGCRLGADIHLTKRLPMGGGIGGGSSNAATALLGLNELWQTKLSLDQLAEIGLSLGADVPIFVHGFAAFAQGVGEKLTPMEIDEPWYVVIAPPVHVSTQMVFQAKQLPRNTKPLEKLPLDPWILRNDCQDLVSNLYPEVEKALDWLLEYAPARMTGSGCCVFAKFANKSDARRCFAQRPDGFEGFVAKGCNISPLHRQLSR